MNRPRRTLWFCVAGVFKKSMQIQRTTTFSSFELVEDCMLMLTEVGRPHKALSGKLRVQLDYFFLCRTFGYGGGSKQGWWETCFGKAELALSSNSTVLLNLSSTLWLLHLLVHMILNPSTSPLAIMQFRKRIKFILALSFSTYTDNFTACCWLLFSFCFSSS